MDIERGACSEKLRIWIWIRPGSLALDKLYEVAMRSRRRRPLVLVITKIQNFHNDDQGRNLLLQIQQYAERWAIRGSVFMLHASAIFLSCI
jgi:hypothetical protein